MQEIKNWLKDHQVLPRISFKDRHEHTIKMIQAKEESFTNNEGELVNGIKFKVYEDGEVKTFFTASQDLLLKLSECQEGDIYRVKMCAKNIGGVIKTYYEVKKMEGETEVDVEAGEADDIPVIEDQDEPTEKDLEKVFGKE
jgi:hypothetical protein